MERARPIGSLLACCLLTAAAVALVPAAPGIAAGQAVPDARLTVADVSVSPDTPVAGAPVTADVTVGLSAGSASPVRVRRVVLRSDDGDRRAVARGVGALSPGDSVSVPLTTTFDDPGQKDLSVVVVGENESGDEVRIARPATVVVERGRPLVEVRAGDAVAGVSGDVGVRVANPTTEPLRDVTVEVRTGDGSVERRTLAALGAGEARTVNASVRPAASGERSVTASVSYTTARGTRATTTADATVTVEPLREDVGVRVEPVRGGGAESDVGGGLRGLVGADQGQAGATDGDGGDDPPDRARVTVTNFGNGPGRLPPGASESVVVDLSAVRTGPVRFDATYDVVGRPGSGSGSAGAVYNYRPPSGAVTVTGVNVTVEGDRVWLTGNAGNPGRTAVSGVVLRVGETEHVRPAYPQRDYFVGTVEGSEFAPFELTARVDAANATAIPVRVTYTVGGEQRVETVRLPLERDREAGGASVSGPSPPVVAGLLIALGAAGGLAFAFARRR
ncbi:hypothetical protein BRC94_03985 [Halobacteriales archaeon QS_5_70_17]|nr:MAG: hypothetical protein BRC94_03985 [Halobacteriales archaeon QS_5_70_17]